MDVRGYLSKLAEVYIITSAGLAQLVLLDDGYHYQIIVNKEAKEPMRYNLGFRLGKVAWISRKRSLMNLEMLNEILSNEYMDNLIGVEPGSNKLVVKIYDRFGNVIKKYKIKYLTLNLFKFDSRRFYKK